MDFLDTLFGKNSFSGTDGGFLGSKGFEGALGLGKIGFDYFNERQNRKREEDRFNKMFDFNAQQVGRTNRLEDERQKTIDDYYGNRIPMF